MKKLAKRIFAFILTLALVFTFMPLSFVSADPASGATVVDSGEFEGRGSALWRLYSDGTLVVDSGFIDWEYWYSPWNDNRHAVTAIVFSGPITAGYSLAGLFADLSNVTAIKGLAYFDTSNVETMEGMFAGASALTSLDLSSWNTYNVQDMGGMFAYMSSLASLNLSGWDTGNVILMDGMFYETNALTSLDISHFDTANVEDMGFMFFASGLTSLDLSGWNTHNVGWMDQMFYGASALASLDLSGWNTRNVEEMDWMFYGTYSLRQLILSENFSFTGNPKLPSSSGVWQNTRTEAILTSEQLMETFDGASMYGTWILHHRISVTRNITVTFGATQYFLDGEAFTQPTMVYNGVAYLPAAYLARRLGLTARWDAETDTTTLTSTGNPPVSSDAEIPVFEPVTRSINALFGATQYFLDGESFTQDTLVYNGVAYLPAAYLARKLGLTAHWDAATDTTTLTSR